MEKDKSKVLWWLGCLLAMLILLLGILVQWLNEDDYNKLLLIIPYKWQLLIWLLIIVLILLTFTYPKAFPKSTNMNFNRDWGYKEIPTPELKSGEEQPNFSGNIMGNLSPVEASILMEFLKKRNKVNKFIYDSNVKILIRNDVLQCLTYKAPPSFSEIRIREWAWEWINKNEDKLRAKLL